MEYIDGESLSALSRAASGEIPLPIVVAIVSEMLHGLHSAHEAKSESGDPLGIVHRDISPQNVLVGADGVARLVDFGIARATGRVGTTNEGELKGKIAYMAPEQIRREQVTRKADIFAAGVVLWELLTGQRLFAADNPGSTIEKILVGWVAAPSSIKRDLPAKIDEIALRALDADPNNRFETAREMAVALEDAAQRALGRDVAAWVEDYAESLASRRALVAAAERAIPTIADPSVRTGPLPLAVAHPQVEPDETRTVCEPTMQYLSDFEIEPTAFAFGASDTLEPVNRATGYPPITLSRSRAKRGNGKTKAVVTVALAAALTVFVGRRYGADARVAAAAAELPMAATTFAPQAPIATQTPMPPSITTGVPISMPAAPFATAHASGIAAQPSAVRRVAKPRPAPAPATGAHTPCVAKLDPATGKTIYKGDCD
jgi:serine/threonine-protein kinase